MKINSSQNNTSFQTSSSYYNESYLLYELFSPQERIYYHQIKDKLQREVEILKAKEAELTTKLKSRKDYVPKGELFELKYQVIDSFYSQNIQSYIDILNNLHVINDENRKIQQKISSYEAEIENQIEKRQSLFEESRQISESLDFSNLTTFAYPKLKSINEQDFTRINFTEIEEEGENENEFKNHVDFFIENIHKKISWNENRLNTLKNEINKFDTLLDTFNESTKKEAACSITSTQQTLSKKNEIGAESLKITIDDLQKLYEESQKTVFELEGQNEELRKKKFKNNLDFENNLTKIKMLKTSSFDCFKREISEMKNKIKHLKRLINSKADEYEVNCGLLMDVFNEFDTNINAKNEEIKKIWNFETRKFDQVEEEEVVEEEEEIVEVLVDDPSQKIHLDELKMKKNDLKNDIKMLNRQLKKLVFDSNQKKNVALNRLENLHYRVEKNKNYIASELKKLKKIPPSKSNKCINQLNSSLLKLEQLVNNA